MKKNSHATVASAHDKDLSRNVESAPSSYFDAVYRRSANPWRYGSDYESEKLRILLDTLPDQRYAEALEIGCGPGVTSAALAQRCNILTATDCSEVALDLARTHCRALHGLTFIRMRVPKDLPRQARYDLVVFSEVGYYLNAVDLAATVDGLAMVSVDRGTVALVHWLNESGDHRTSGQEVYNAFTTHPAFTPITGQTAERHGNRYRVDVLRRIPRLALTGTLQRGVRIRGIIHGKASGGDRRRLRNGP